MRAQPLLESGPFQGLECGPYKRESLQPFDKQEVDHSMGRWQLNRSLCELLPAD